MILAKTKTSTIRTAKSTFAISSIAARIISSYGAWIKKRARPELPRGAFYLSGDGAYVHPGNAQTRRIATFLDQFSADRFGYSFPRLHALSSELCSFRHRIRLVWQRGESRPLQMGPLYYVDSQSAVPAENTRTQARIRDIERLKLECPWASCEDGHLFLLGWDAGWESSGSSRENIETSAGNNCSFRFLESQARQSYAAPKSSAIDQT